MVGHLSTKTHSSHNKANHTERLRRPVFAALGIIKMEIEQFLIEFTVVAIFLQFPVWRIYQRAGIKPVISLTVLVPVLGIFICGLILSLSEWQIQSLENK